MTFQKLIDEVQKGLVPQPLRTARVERAEVIPIANGERRVEEPPQRAQCHRQRRRQDLAPRHRRRGDVAEARLAKSFSISCHAHVAMELINACRVVGRARVVHRSTRRED